MKLEDNVEVLGAEGIIVFCLDYISGDPALGIPIDRFVPKLRDDLSFSFAVVHKKHYA